jgi:DNA topoisomerase IB
LTVTVGEIPIPTIVLALSFNLWCGETTTACNSKKHVACSQRDVPVLRQLGQQQPGRFQLTAEPGK